MKQISVKVIIFISAFIRPVESFAWGANGHAIIAEIAFRYMDEATRKNVLKYLKGMTFDDAANWMDYVRSDHSYDYMKPYHYQDFEKGEAANLVSGNNIMGVLDSTLEDLNRMSKLSYEEIRIRILYLFHLIGDLHQPLHVGYPEDKGGNLFQVSFFGTGSNLHKVWDAEIIDYKTISLDDCLRVNTYSSQELDGIQKINIVAWANESRSYLDLVYALNNHKMNEQYINSAVPIIEKQLLNAGIRLAAILEKYFRKA